MRIYKVLPSLIFITILYSCSGNVRPAGPSVIKSSANEMPSWVMKKKTASDYVYFVGMAEKSPNLKTAKNSSINDAVAQLVNYIGFRATTSFKSIRSSAETDNISSFRDEIFQTINGSGSASVTVDLEDFFYQEYSDNSYDFYSLIKFPNAWVVKERDRLQKLTLDQRSKAEEYLGDADSAIIRGDLSGAIDFCINALVIASKASENSDLYQQAQNQISLILSGLSFRLTGTNPELAYIEGGSDPINVMITSSKTGGAVKGLPMDANEVNSTAVIEGNSGRISDPGGIVSYSVEKVNSGIHSISLSITYSMNKFREIKNIDEDFYKNILDISSSKALIITLGIANRDKAMPMVITIVQAESTGNFGFDQGFQEKVSAEFALAGYKIVNIRLPIDSLESGKQDSRRLKDTIIAYLKDNVPAAKRLLFGIFKINSLGKIGKDIKFSSYDLNNSDLSTVEMKFNYTINDIENGSLVKGTNFTEKGIGLDDEQAGGKAEKNILGKIIKNLNSD